MKTNQTYGQGMAAYNAGRYDEALGRLEALVNVSGATGVLSRFYLGRTHQQVALDHFRRHRFKEAASHFEAAARWNPLGGGVERFLAACYVRTGQLDLAIDQLRWATAAEPGDVEARIRLAMALWRSADQQEALDTLRAGVDLCPDHAELHYQLGVLHAGRACYTEAEASFRRAVELDARHLGALERLAQCCGLRGDLAEASRWLHHAHQFEPLNPRIGFQLSLLAQVRGVPPVEATTGDTALLPEPDRKAIERLGEVIIAEPDFISAFLSLPSSDVDHEVFTALAVTLERAMARQPEYADLHYHCGAVYRRLGRHDAAIERAEQAVRLNPKFVNALILLGELYSQTERWPDSVERLKEAIAEGGDYADVHYMLGRLLQKAGQVDQARDAFERALVLNRDYRPAREALKVLQAS